MGGRRVAVYIRNGFNVSKEAEPTLNDDYIVTVFVKISKSNKTFGIGTCYRPPNSNLNLDMLKLDADRASSSFNHKVNSLSLIPTIYIYN